MDIEIRTDAMASAVAIIEIEFHEPPPGEDIYMAARDSRSGGPLQPLQIEISQQDSCIPILDLPLQILGYSVQAPMPSARHVSSPVPVLSSAIAQKYLLSFYYCRLVLTSLVVHDARIPSASADTLERDSSVQIHLFSAIVQIHSEIIFAYLFLI